MKEYIELHFQKFKEFVKGLFKQFITRSKIFKIECYFKFCTLYNAENI